MVRRCTAGILVVICGLVSASQGTQPPCAETGVAYVDALRSNGTAPTGAYVADASTCQVACTDALSCEYFTWYESDGACWLLRGEVVMKPSGQAVSGPRICAPTLAQAAGAVAAPVSGNGTDTHYDYEAAEKHGKGPWPVADAAAAAPPEPDAVTSVRPEGPMGVFLIGICVAVAAALGALAVKWCGKASEEEGGGRTTRSYALMSLGLKDQPGERDLEAQSAGASASVDATPAVPRWPVSFFAPFASTASFGSAASASVDASPTPRWPISLFAPAASTASFGSGSPRSSVDVPPTFNPYLVPAYNQHLWSTASGAMQLPASLGGSVAQVSSSLSSSAALPVATDKEGQPVYGLRPPVIDPALFTLPP